RLAARESRSRLGDALLGKRRAERMEAGASHGPRGELARQAETGFAKPRMSRAHPPRWQVKCQANPLSSACINHNCRAATIVSRRGIMPRLPAAAPLAKLGQNKLREKTDADSARAPDFHCGFRYSRSFCRKCGACSEEIRSGRNRHRN